MGAGNGTAGGGGGGAPVVDATHLFQEYTYKKITPCDICSQILRGECLARNVMYYVVVRISFKRVVVHKASTCRAICFL